MATVELDYEYRTEIKDTLEDMAEFMYFLEIESKDIVYIGRDPYGRVELMYKYWK